MGYQQTNVRRGNLGHSRLCCANRNTYDTHNRVNIVIKYLTQMDNLIKVDCNIIKNSWRYLFTYSITSQVATQLFCSLFLRTPLKLRFSKAAKYTYFLEPAPPLQTWGTRSSFFHPSLHKDRSQHFCKKCFE